MRHRPLNKIPWLFSPCFPLTQEPAIWNTGRIGFLRSLPGFSTPRCSPSYRLLSKTKIIEENRHSLKLRGKSTDFFQITTLEENMKKIGLRSRLLRCAAGRPGAGDGHHDRRQGGSDVKTWLALRVQLGDGKLSEGSWRESAHERSFASSALVASSRHSVSRATSPLVQRRQIHFVAEYRL